jgi:hypothetical protein
MRRGRARWTGVRKRPNALPPLDRWLAIGAVQRARGVVELTRGRAVWRLLEGRTGTRAAPAARLRGPCRGILACERRRRCTRSSHRSTCAPCRGVRSTLEESPAMESYFELVVPVARARGRPDDRSAARAVLRSRAESGGGCCGVRRGQIRRGGCSGSLARTAPPPIKS